jgi:hypothetical protein
MVVLLGDAGSLAGGGDAGGGAAEAGRAGGRCGGGSVGRWGGVPVPPWNLPIRASIPFAGIGQMGIEKVSLR